MKVVVAGLCGVASDVLGSIPTAGLVNVTDCWKLRPDDILCGLDKSLYSLLVLLFILARLGTGPLTLVTCRMYSGLYKC